MYGILSFIGFSTSYKRKMVNNIVSIEAILIHKGYERFFIDGTSLHVRFRLVLGRLFMCFRQAMFKMKQCLFHF